LSAAPHLHGSVFLVDDASSVAERQLVRSAVAALPLPIQWISLPQRRGFVGAVNAAWPRCASAVSVILNSDTVPSADLLPKLLAALDRDLDIGAIAPASDSRLDLYQYRPAEGRGAEITCVPYLTAMCLMIRRRAVAGPVFDPVFSPGYFEDLDLCCRLRAGGWRLAVLESRRIHHTGRATFGLDPELGAVLTRNYATFAARWSHLPEHSDLAARLHGPAFRNGTRP
jgi:GT2 family glycosyltransferase